MGYICQPQKTCEWCGKVVAEGYYIRHHGDNCSKKRLKTLFGPIEEKINTYLGLYESLIEEFGKLHNKHMDFLNKPKMIQLRLVGRNYRNIARLLKDIQRLHRGIKKDIASFYPNRFKANKMKKDQENGNNSTTDATKI